eukprot:1701539-Rhodomonas_salina.1
MISGGGSKPVLALRALRGVKRPQTHVPDPLLRPLAEYRCNRTQLSITISGSTIRSVSTRVGMVPRVAPYARSVPERLWYCGDRG